MRKMSGGGGGGSDRSSILENQKQNFDEKTDVKPHLKMSLTRRGKRNTRNC
jgi:hypothetical protein